MDNLRFAAFGCIHAPFHDPEAIDWMVEQISDYRPDVIVELGDLVEANASSRWDDAVELNVALKREYEVADDILKRIRLSGKRSKKLVKLPGNHEDNIMAMGRLDPRLRGLCDWRTGMKELEHWSIPCDYNYCRTRGAFRIGQVCFVHGYEAGVTSDEAQALYFCNEYGLMVSAHTHRPTPSIQQCFKTKRLPLRYWYANVGCLRDMDPNYMRRNRKMGWGQAIVLGEAPPIKSPRARRTWDAEVRVHKMYDETYDTEVNHGSISPHH